MKLILLMTMLAAVTLTHAATNAVPSSAEQEKMFMEAVLLSSQGLYAEAEVRLKRLAEVQPNEPTVVEMLRLVQLKLHDPSEVLTKRLATIISRWCSFAPPVRRMSSTISDTRAASSPRIKRKSTLSGRFLTAFRCPRLLSA